MSFKENFESEKAELLQNKKPYETAAFIIFGILFIQQMFFLLRAILEFLKKGQTFFPNVNITVAANNQNFFNRIVALDSTSWFYVLLAIGALVLYFFLIYLFVWNYCKKRGLAKWTWTLFVVYGPGIFLAPAYIWYVIYVFRPYIFRFLKRGYEEFKSFDPKTEFKEEQEEKEEMADYQ